MLIYPDHAFVIPDQASHGGVAAQGYARNQGDEEVHRSTRAVLYSARVPWPFLGVRWAARRCCHCARRRRCCSWAARSCCHCARWRFSRAHVSRACLRANAVASRPLKSSRCKRQISQTPSGWSTACSRQAGHDCVCM